MSVWFRVVTFCDEAPVCGEGVRKCAEGRLGGLEAEQEKKMEDDQVPDQTVPGDSEDPVDLVGTETELEPEAEAQAEAQPAQAEATANDVEV